MKGKSHVLPETIECKNSADDSIFHVIVCSLSIVNSHHVLETLDGLQIVMSLKFTSFGYRKQGFTCSNSGNFAAF